jgi:hypothetical protein
MDEYVDNDFFKYSVQLKNDSLYKIVYTKPFPEPPIGTMSIDISIIKGE